jgi:hypothetical protein
MVLDKNNVPNDIATLQALVIEQSQMIGKLTEEIRRLTTMFEKFFGKSSEKLPKEKPTGEMLETLEVPVKRKKGAKNGGGGA